jgi:predicted nucleic-acid-binding protein
LRITPYTNVLVRAALLDHEAQSKAALEVLRAAETIALPLPTLCEFVWVLRQHNRRSPSEVAQSLRQLLDAANVETNRGAVEAGLAMLQAGGDFADGVIAHEGRQLGGTTFVTFDRQAAKLIAKLGGQSALLP